MGNQETEWGEWWECGESGYRNARNQGGNARNQGGNDGNAGNQGGNAGNQGGNDGNQEGMRGIKVGMRGIRVGMQRIGRVASDKFRSVSGATHQPASMGSCLTISYMWEPCLPSSRWLGELVLVFYGPL